MGRSRTFDIGNVYERRGRLYLAVTEHTLVSCFDGDGDLKEFKEFTTTEKHTFNGEISTRDLCEVWDISIEELDQVMSKYFTPDEEAQARVRRKFDGEDADTLPYDDD